MPESLCNAQFTTQADIARTDQALKHVIKNIAAVTPALNLFCVSVISAAENGLYQINNPLKSGKNNFLSQDT